MNKLLQILTLVILGLISHQSLAQSDQLLVHSPYEWVAQTVTAEGRVRVTITKPRVKIHLAKIQRPILRLAVTDNDDDYYDETPEFQVGYRRPELVNQTADVQDVSDEIKIRLLLARKKALAKYHENWG